MGIRHTDARRRPSAGVERDDLDATAPLLSRTRSQEFSVAESIAVQETPPDDEQDDRGAKVWPHSARYLVLLCAFITSLSFGVTQVSLLYVFRLMTCDAYYKDHSSERLNELTQTSPTITSLLEYALAAGGSSAHAQSRSAADRCSIHAIESSTALSVSLLGASTTVFGILNLFVTGNLIKRIGVKPTLMIQVFFPALRLLVQNIGLDVWGSTGIIIIQCSQIISIVGGPSGYLLVLNTFITEIVEHEGRTAALGRLTGSMLFGAALGSLLGGVVAEAFGIKAPFRLTLILFLTACAYVFVFLPNIPPAEAKQGDQDSITKEKKSTAVGKYFGPLTVFAPRKFMGKDGVIRMEYGAFLLAWGVFLAILATGYLPTLLQLYATDVLGFGTRENGGLLFMYSMLRGVFLTFAFPELIALGRKRTMKRKESRSHARNVEGSGSPERQPLLEAEPGPNTPIQADTDTAKEHRKEQPFTFDLTYTRFSLLADALLTLLCSFAREGWQMYLVAAVLPFAAGTGSASKGTILQMVGASASSAERTDALAGVSLVENMARLSTTFVFGVVFAAFASIGRTELVFTCNAAVALIGFGVLMFARFPREGSHRLDQEDTSTSAT